MSVQLETNTALAGELPGVSNEVSTHVSASAAQAASVVFLTHHPEQDSGTRYRILQFLPYLEQAGFDCSVRPFSSPRLFSILHKRGAYAGKIALTAEATLRRLTDLSRVRRSDLMFIHREAYPLGIPAAERLFHRFNQRMIFSFDDAIYAGHTSVDDLSNGRLYRLKYGPQVDWVIENSRHVIVGNRFLAEYASKLNPRVSVIPTVVDTQKFRPRESGEASPIRIGWMGSNSTSPYLVPLLPVFQELAKRYGDRIEFHFYGDPQFPRFDRAVIREFRMASEIEDFRSFDIGIMPLPDNVWTRGKCAFKAIQYMAVATPTVASPVGMVDELIQDGKTGLIATSPDSWFRHLSALIEDHGLRRELGNRGRERVESHFSLQVWGPRFAALLREIHEESGKRSRD